MIFEFTLNSDNLSPTKETKFLNFFLKPKAIQFSNFINHVMIYHEFRFISYIDGSFSIEQKINTKRYKVITIQKVPITENKRELQKPHILNFLKNASKQFLNFALEEDEKLYMLFKNAQISILDYRISIDSKNTPYFVSSDKTYVVRFFGKYIYLYDILTGKEYTFTSIFWDLKLDPRIQFDFKTITQIGEFLPSCHHPKVKQTIFKKKIKNNVVNFSLKFQCTCMRGPNRPADYSLYLPDNLHMDLYI